MKNSRYGKVIRLVIETMANFLEPVFIKETDDKIEIKIITSLHEIYLGTFFLIVLNPSLHWVCKFCIIILVLLVNIKFRLLVFNKKNGEIEVIQSNYKIIGSKQDNVFFYKNIQDIVVNSYVRRQYDFFENKYILVTAKEEVLLEFDFTASLHKINVVLKQNNIIVNEQKSL